MPELGHFKSREVSRLSDVATPDAIAMAAQQHGCRSVAFTYNDPVIWAEYAIDTAAACHDRDIRSVAVTAGYISPSARGEFFAAMDAANIDLKAFTEDFYHGITGAHLDSVLDTIRYVCQETSCWVELTNLVIPDANDDPDELRRMCDWVLSAVGCDVPVHFTAFHPDFRMKDRPATSHETLITAAELARAAGLRYAYVGNVHDVQRQSTYCPSCGQLLIERNWHQLGRYQLDGNRCRHCQFEVAGHFETQPGTWGQRRQPIRIQEPMFSSSPSSAANPGQPQEASMPVAREPENFQFDQAQQDLIRQAACRVVNSAAHQWTPTGIDELLGDLAQQPIAGIYVTLKRGDTLRGCCGLQGPPVALGAALVDAATRSTREDPRMPSVVPVELPYLSVSVSVLGSPRPIGVTGDDCIDAVEVGRHGLRIRIGEKSGLLLPGVASERGWDSRQFLDALCNKAGLPPASWRRDDALIHIFDGVEFGGPFLPDPAATTPVEASLVDADQLAKLRQWIGSNLIALQSDAMPFYYAGDVSDGTAAGMMLEVQYDADQPAVSWMKLALRDGMPLQSSLFQLTQSAVASLRQTSDARHWQVRLAVLSSVMHHGVDDQPDFDGLDCRRRAVIAMDGRRWSAGFDRSLEPNDLLKKTLAAEAFRTGGTQVYSAVCDTTAAQFWVSQGPRAQTQVSSRAPAVAGAFYPAGDQQREQAVDDLLQGLTQVPRQKVAAAMVPHAGLKYSGKIAADTWRRIEIPDSVLIIGPKHTAEGVDWAVAPHDRWQLSSAAAMDGAMDLAQQLVDHVPSMEFDAAAHRGEHGIEVQLPLLYRLAPQTRVAAVAMSGGSLDDIEQAATAMAAWIGKLEQPPLLVISSDMNHFADDAENRRRDELALEMLRKNDPRGLLQVCQDENISMCGQLPAALVLLTLQALRRTAEYQQIGYATSADAGGDSARVVGYAGVLF